MTGSDTKVRDEALLDLVRDRLETTRPRAEPKPSVQ